MELFLCWKLYSATFIPFESGQLFRDDIIIYISYVIKYDWWDD